MPSILEAKQALADIRTDLTKEMQHGMDMVNRKDITLDEITAQSTRIDLLQAK